jgi:hypothetical protein
MRFALVVVCVLATSASAEAAAQPFAAYYTPAALCDAKPVAPSCRRVERALWRAFLGNRLGDVFTPVTSIRLTDLFRGEDDPHGGWVFSVVVPKAPPRVSKLRITLGVVEIRQRYVRSGSLVIDVAIERGTLAPGAHELIGMDGTRQAFALDLVLEDGAPDDLDPAAAAAADALATTKPPFMVARLPTKPDCDDQAPPPAGCHRAPRVMWRELFSGTLGGHPHATRFVSDGRFWRMLLVFPTAPATDVRIELDGEPVLAPSHQTFDTDARFFQLTFLVRDTAPGTHRVRAVDSTGTVLFATDAELVR